MITKIDAHTTRSELPKSDQYDIPSGGHTDHTNSDSKSLKKILFRDSNLPTAGFLVGHFAPGLPRHCWDSLQ